MKKTYLILVSLFILFVSCTKDSDDAPQLFLANHVGFWETTFFDLETNVAAEVTPSKVKIYSKAISDGCYSPSRSISGGVTKVETHTATEYTAVTSNVPVANVFSGSDLEIVLDLGISLVDIAVSYASSGENFISFAEIIYESNTTNELLTVSGNLGRINVLVKC